MSPGSPSLSSSRSAYQLMPSSANESLSGALGVSSGSHWLSTRSRSSFLNSVHVASKSSTPGWICTARSSSPAISTLSTQSTSSRLSAAGGVVESSSRAASQPRKCPSPSASTSPGISSPSQLSSMPSVGLTETAASGGMAPLRGHSPENSSAVGFGKPQYSTRLGFW